MVVDLVITIGIGFIGYIAAKKIKLPAYALVGALIAVAIYNVWTDNVYFPVEIRPVIQILAGIFIGKRVTRKELHQLKGSYKPIMISVGSILAYSVVMGFVVQKLAHLDYVTSAFATAPGGLMDITLIGMDMGADMGVVTTMQMVRLITIVSVFPLFINKILKKTGKAKSVEKIACTVAERKGTGKEIAITLSVGGISGGIGYLTGFPAMALITSMFGVAFQNVFFDNAYLPKQVRSILQIFAGILIGQTITMKSVESIQLLIIPTLLMVCVYIGMTLIIGIVLYKATDLDFPTALFACCPGGATDISLICEDFGANSVMVSMIQYPRVFTVIAFYPMIIQFFS